jgi:8-oxo-dGTP pyrophosphatase MutT (NUDIX family)
MDNYVPAKPAGTVVLLRSSEQSFEVLLLKRNPKLASAGGVWVFPGGAVDEDEARVFADECSAAKVAARREIFEECGLDVGEVELRHFCKWTTPREEKKRFSTWFFVAVTDQASSRILVDGSEIIDYQWISPKSAIQKHQEGSISFMPPTFLV